MASWHARLVSRAPELVVSIAILAFLGMGDIYADRLPVWHEVVSALPSSGYRVIESDPDGGRPRIPLEPSCTGPNSPTLVFSSSRPGLGLCAAGQTLPVMVTSYASGVGSWPFALGYAFHRDDTFALRRVWLLFAAFSLVLVFRLVRRVADRATAAVACVVTALSTPFVMINALLLPFETMPSTLVIAALAVWMGPPRADRAPVHGARVLAGGVLLGLALATNLKAAFFVLPLAALALRRGHRLRGLGAKKVALAAAGIVLPLLPTLAFALTDPQGDFAAQFARRTGSIADNLSPDRVVTEAYLLVNFAADVTSYLSLVTQHGLPPLTWMHVAAGVPLLYTTVAAATHLGWGRPRGSLFAAATGSVVITFVVVSIVLYRQYPGGNYAPLHDVLGLAIAAGCVDGSQWVSAALARQGRSVPALGMASVLAVLLVAGSIHNLFARLDPLARFASSTNATVERELAAYLRASTDDIPLLTTSYNDAGVIDALGHGEVRALDGHHYLEACDHEAQPARCVRMRLGWLFSREDGLPMRISVPAALSLVDRPVVILAALPEAIEQAARDLGAIARIERTFTTASRPATVLYRIDAPPGGLVRRAGELHAPGVPPTETREQACTWHVPEALVSRLFDALSEPGADGCRLADVHGERAMVTLSWAAQPSATLVAPCVGSPERPGPLVARVPPELEQACPDAIASLRGVVSRAATEVE